MIRIGGSHRPKKRKRGFITKEGWEDQNLINLRSVEGALMEEERMDNYLSRTEFINRIRPKKKKPIDFFWGAESDPESSEDDIERIMDNPNCQMIEMDKRKKKDSEKTKKLRLLRKKDPGWWEGFGAGHFTWLIPAKRFSGKSVLIQDLVKNRLVSRDPDGKVSKIQFFQKRILISPTAHLDQSLDAELFDEVITGDESLADGGRGMINDRIREIMMKQKLGKQRKSMLLVMDDIMGMLGNTTADLINRFSSKNRHYEVSLLIAGQTFKMFSPTLRTNTSHWCIFRVLNREERRKMFEELEGMRQFYDKVDWDHEEFGFLFLVDKPGPKTEVYHRFDNYLGNVEEVVLDEDLKKTRRSYKRDEIEN